MTCSSGMRIGEIIQLKLSDVEYAVTISDTEKIDRNYSDMQKDNSELRGIVDSPSRQLKRLEKRIEIN